MSLPPPTGLRLLPVLVAALGACACARDTAGGEAPAAATMGCLSSGEGRLEAALRGALVADLDWQNQEMQCDGDTRPDGHGLRITISGPLPAGAVNADSKPTGHQLRFIFGIDLRDVASGSAQALPTNLTVIVEGGQQLYATRGDDKCAVENLERTPLAGSGGKVDRVIVRGYCTAPASDLAGATRVLVPTFTFTALMRSGNEP
jgi:hypothetical protein